MSASLGNGALKPYRQKQDGPKKNKPQTFIIHVVMCAGQEQKLSNVCNWSNDLKVLCAVEKWHTQQRSLVEKNKSGSILGEEEIHHVDPEIWPYTSPPPGNVLLMLTRWIKPWKKKMGDPSTSSNELFHSLPTPCPWVPAGVQGNWITQGQGAWRKIQNVWQ